MSPKIGLEVMGPGPRSRPGWPIPIHTARPYPGEKAKLPCNFLVYSCVTYLNMLIVIVSTFAVRNHGRLLTHIDVMFIIIVFY